MLLNSLYKLLKAESLLPLTSPQVGISTSEVWHNKKLVNGETIRWGMFGDSVAESEERMLATLGSDVFDC